MLYFVQSYSKIPASSPARCQTTSPAGSGCCPINSGLSGFSVSLTQTH